MSMIRQQKDRFRERIIVRRYIGGERKISFYKTNGKQRRKRDIGR